MATKFEIRSPRVKGIAFHPDLPWVLCGLHNGTVQLWDYCMKTSIDTFTDHAGAVRGVDFHRTQPLFVTGADDYLVKVWNYKLRRCLFTLTGHKDYVRTTYFHREQPWIVSCSDDFTVRIWNWQSRSSLACLPGHNHFVMCAQFSPHTSLVVSASLDKTARVWDIAGLYTHKQAIAAATASPDLLGAASVTLRYQITGHQKGVNWAAFHPTAADMLLTAADDCTIIVWSMDDETVYQAYTLRAHTHNVCCAMFVGDDILSCSEDRTVRCWKTDRGFARGQTRTQHAVLFQRDADRYWILAKHPKNNLLAAGHDAGLQVFKLTSERMPHAVLGNGTLLYCYGDSLREVALEAAAVATGGSGGRLAPSNLLATAAAIATPTTAAATVKMLVRVRGVWGEKPHVLLVEPQGPAAVRASGNGVMQATAAAGNRYGAAAGGSGRSGSHTHATGAFGNYGSNSGSGHATTTMRMVLLYKKSGTLASVVADYNARSENWPQVSAKCNATGVAFYAPGKLVFSTRDGALYTTDLSFTTREPLSSATLKTPVVFAGPTGCVLCYSEGTLYLLQVAQRATVAEATVPAVRRVVWDRAQRHVALCGKNTITVLTRRLRPVTVVTESSVRIKSAVFHPACDILFYSTANHIKCCHLGTGECTTIRTTSEVCYLVHAEGKALWALQRSGAVSELALSDHELLFRLNLTLHNYADAVAALRAGAIRGQALIGYMHKHGQAEIALHVVSDPLTRFHLALECGAMDMARSTAAQLNEPHAWQRLAAAAARTGDVQLAQMAYAKARQPHAAALLALATGNVAALEQLVDGSSNSSSSGNDSANGNDAHFRLHYAMYLPDVQRRIRLLAQAQQLPLAYVLAQTHAMHDVAAELLAAMDADVAARVQASAQALRQQRARHATRSTNNNDDNNNNDNDDDDTTDVVVTPETGNWPMLPVEPSIFARLLQNPEQANELLATRMRCATDAAHTTSPHRGRRARHGNGTSVDADYAAATAYDDNDDSDDDDDAHAQKRKTSRGGDVTTGHDVYDSATDDDDDNKNKNDDGDGDGGGGWDDDDDLGLDINAALGGAGGAAAAAAGDDSDAYEGDAAEHDTSDGAMSSATTSTAAVVPRASVCQHWVEAYRVAACHVAAGGFASALALLREQVGLVDAAPLQPYMLQLWSAVNAARPASLSLPRAQPSVYALTTPPGDDGSSDSSDNYHAAALSAPALPDYLPLLETRLQTMGRLFTEGRFVDAKATAESVLHHLLVTVARDAAQAEAHARLRHVAAEYARALSLQLHLRGAAATAATATAATAGGATVAPTSTQALQLALYVTYYALGASHLTLALSQAMAKAYKTQHLVIAAQVARRLLELAPPEAKARQARAILAEADRNPTNATSEVVYDPRATSQSLCCVSHTLLHGSGSGGNNGRSNSGGGGGGDAVVTCGLCESVAHARYAGTRCPVCSVTALGASTDTLLYKL